MTIQLRQVCLVAHKLQPVISKLTEVLGVTMTIRIIVLVFVAPLAGRVADVIGRKATLIATDILRVFVVAAFIFVTEVWQIYALAVLLNLGSALFTPIYKAVIPGVTGETAYPKALAAGTIAYDLSQICGPALAALLINLVSIDGSFLVNAVTFLISAALIMPLSLSHLGEKTAQKKNSSDLLFGMRRMLAVPELRHSLLLALRVSIVGALALVSTIGYVTVELGLEKSMYAWAMAALGVGSMLGVTVYAYLPENQQSLVERLALPMLIASLVLAAMVREYWALIVAWILSGAGQGIHSNLSNRLLAANSSEDERPHIYAAHFSLSHIGWGLTYPIAGFLPTAFGDFDFETTCWIFLGLLALTLLAGKPGGIQRSTSNT